MSTTMRWVALALLGVLIAVGVSIAASGLVSQQIGLASEPITAGDALAPQATAGTKRHQGAGGKKAPAKTPTSHTPPPVTTTAPEPVEPQPPVTAPPATTPTAPTVPSGSSPHGGEGDHGGGGGGGGGGGADD